VALGAAPLAPGAWAGAASAAAGASAQVVGGGGRLSVSAAAGAAAAVDGGGGAVAGASAAAAASADAWGEEGLGLLNATLQADANATANADGGANATESSGADDSANATAAASAEASVTAGEEAGEEGAPRDPRCSAQGVWRQGPPGQWLEDGAGVDNTRSFSDTQDLEDQMEQVQGGWTPANAFTPDREFAKQPDGGDESNKGKGKGGGDDDNNNNPCPCKWQSKKYHLTKCNWFSCGPPPASGGAQGYVKITRLKTSEEMVSDYQSERAGWRARGRPSRQALQPPPHASHLHGAFACFASPPPTTRRCRLRDCGRWAAVDEPRHVHVHVLGDEQGVLHGRMPRDAAVRGHVHPAHSARVYGHRPL